ncbi:transposon Ty3-I Gag-Pol polyprotein [Trichonephila clavipes]|nr:transposon Ty3-I Gag-Pol polyprotein [Trichonephila clavipes]
MGKECDMFYACKGKSFSEFTHRACHNQNDSRKDFKYIPPNARREVINLNSKENKFINSKQSRLNKKIECYICGENHLARDCNRKYSKLKNEKKETSQVQYVQPKVDLEPLKYVIVNINGKAINCVLDSGTQIFICNSDTFPDSSNDEFRKITLSSAFGENVEAKLIKTALALHNNSLNHPMDCLVAITDKLNADALIPPALYESLCSINDKNNKKENEIFAESAGSSITFSNDENEAECGKDIFYVESVSDNINFNSDYTKMKDEQNTCDSLEKVRAELKLNKGTFLLIDGLIYHRDKILNEPVMQLVLPRCRIDKVMKLAHESVFGGHMGVKKTKERIKYNFFWPNMSGKIAKFVQTCKGCQLRKPEKIGDRAPITPIVRPELPFEIVNIDVIGPIQPPSGRGHKCVLCMMDQHTRWPEAVPLRSLTAKNACDYYKYFRGLEFRV